jgi:hypothetical protein
MTVTATFAGEAEPTPCRTRDVSETGLFLECARAVDAGTRVHLSLLDEERGDCIELDGMITRTLPKTATGLGGLGVRLDAPPAEWTGLVRRMAMAAREATPTDVRKVRRLRVLVVGDKQHLRGTNALWVQSGWDVRFASDLPGVQEALRGFSIDAVIAEMHLDDGRWTQVLEAARQAHPDARRIIRSALGGKPSPPAGQRTDLVHRVVDIAGGLEAVLDALSADWGA